MNSATKKPKPLLIISFYVRFLEKVGLSGPQVNPKPKNRKPKQHKPQNPKPKTLSRP